MGEDVRDLALFDDLGGGHRRSPWVLGAGAVQLDIAQARDQAGDLYTALAQELDGRSLVRVGVLARVLRVALVEELWMSGGHRSALGESLDALRDARMAARDVVRDHSHRTELTLVRRPLPPLFARRSLEQGKQLVVGRGEPRSQVRGARAHATAIETV
jgi:hypothetical protein